MAKIYLEKLIELINEINLKDFNDINDINNINIEFKHFFSGAAGYVNGKITMSLTPVGFALKLPEKLRNKLLKKNGTKQLRYFPKAPIKTEYVVLSEEIVDNKEYLQKLVFSNIKYVISIQL